MTTEKTKKNEKIFCCIFCDFNTCKKQIIQDIVQPLNIKTTLRQRSTTKKPTKNTHVNAVEKNTMIELDYGDIIRNV
jgi:hypothetical protein